jgi:hypothetical protein
MAKFEEHPEQPPQPIPVSEIAKEGVTAGDVQLQKAIAAAPDPQKDPFGYLIYVMEQGFGSVHQRLDQQGKLVADMAEKVYGPQAEAGHLPNTAQPGLAGLFNADTLNKFLDLAKEQFGGGPDRIYTDIGRRVVDGATDTAIKRIIRNVGGEAAGTITHVG